MTKPYCKSDMDMKTKNRKENKWRNIVLNNLTNSRISLKKLTLRFIEYLVQFKQIKSDKIVQK